MSGQIEPPVPRRHALKLIGSSIISLLTAYTGLKHTTVTANTLPVCVLTPQQTEGPYFVDEMLKRTDIRTDPTDGSMMTGIPLQLELQVYAVQQGHCQPLPHAQVDIWHCNAEGIYSDVRDFNFDTSGKKFLRGYQITDQTGTVRFTTIYPGWYPGRTVHIHVKVRAQGSKGQALELTSQLYFDDQLTDQVYTLPPYAKREERFPRNADDGIFRRGGKQLLLSASGDKTGYQAAMAIGIEV